VDPSPSLRFTISAYLGSFTLSRMTRGPFTPEMVLWEREIIISEKYVFVSIRGQIYVWYLAVKRMRFATIDLVKDGQYAFVT
jgi:hypothetical protein